MEHNRDCCYNVVFSLTWARYSTGTKPAMSENKAGIVNDSDTQYIYIYTYPQTPQPHASFDCTRKSGNSNLYTIGFSSKYGFFCFPWARNLAGTSSAISENTRAAWLATLITTEAFLPSSPIPLFISRHKAKWKEQIPCSTWGTPTFTPQRIWATGTSDAVSRS